ncbi:MAG: hypothetical protein ACLVGP_05730, partial [Oscillospiraceae bacterium]
HLKSANIKIISSIFSFINSDLVNTAHPLCLISADSRIRFMSAARYAHSIKKHRIIKFPGEHGQLIRPGTFTKRLRKIYDALHHAGYLHPRLRQKGRQRGIAGNAGD